MYSLSAFGRMVLDDVRVAAYRAALAAAIRPGCTVLELGTGAGFFALHACALGARHVYAVEPNPVVGVARQVAAANGLQDRISFLPALSTQVSLPVPADVLVSDLRGVLPLHSFHLPSIADARSRLLRPDAPQIPGLDRIFAALVSAPDVYQTICAPWESSAGGWDWSVPAWIVRNKWSQVSLSPSALLTDPVLWSAIDYRAVQTPNVNQAISLPVREPGIAHGILLWFDTELLPGIGFSNAPGQRVAIYKQAFFPLQSPLPVQVGQTVALSLRADLFGDDYTWSWRTRLPGIADFRQSTFHAILPDQTASTHPAGSPKHAAAAWLLPKMNGAQTQQQLAQALQAEFPLLFPGLPDAFRFVAAFASALT